MSPRTKTQYIEIREDRKKQLMDIALELFANEGYHHTTISNIAHKAGISKGLLYNYFQSKEDLLLQLVDNQINSLLVHFDPNRDGVLTRTEVIFMVEMLFKVLVENPDTWRLYFSVLFQPDVSRIIGEKFRTLKVNFMEIITDYFRKIGRKNPLAEVWFLHVIFDGIYMNYVTNPENFPLDEIKELIVKRIELNE